MQYTEHGDLVIEYRDDPHKIVDYMLETQYSGEFCLSLNFRSEFIARLMEAGFLVMSMKFSEPGEKENFILLPKLHLLRSALFFENLHIKKSIRKYLDSYELCFDTDFDFILNRCLEIHGDAWLTSPLVNAIKIIRRLTEENDPAGSLYKVRPVSFALYSDGKLAAGEFGIISGRVYTSYSGYFDESNAGTVQLIKTTQYLRDNGFAFFDLGMPLDYKTALGAQNISPEEFVRLWRDSR